MKNFEFRFAKLFTKTRNDGYYGKSIIAFSKQPYKMEAIDRGNGQFQNFVREWRYVLLIDLWLIELKFDWTK